MTTFPIVDDKHYHSRRASSFAAYVLEREQAQERFIAGRQDAHDLSARVRAAKKREDVRLEIARRPRGQTEILGHREDGSPIHRYVCAVRPRPYTRPEDRVAVERGAMTIGNMRPHVETRGPSGGINDVSTMWRNRVRKRDARRIRMASKRRRGWR